MFLLGKTVEFAKQIKRDIQQFDKVDGVVHSFTPARWRLLSVTRRSGNIQTPIGLSRGYRSIRFDLLVHQPFAANLFYQGNCALTIRDLPSVVAEIKLAQVAV